MRDTTDDYFEQCRNIIREAEIGLRSLLTSAAKNGDYEALSNITSFAREIRRLSDQLEIGEGREEAVATVSQPPQNYPRFYRTTDSRLLMIGWSKKGETEYEHKAPRSVLDQLVTALREGCSNGEPIPIEQLLASVKSKDGADLPDYYARTFLRWLRSVGLVVKHGHQGYLIKNSREFEAAVQSHWRSLAVK